MTKEHLASLLNDREYRSEITELEERVAKESGLVVVFGASDDLMEFRGAIDDEVGCYNGGDALLVNGALFVDDGCDCRAARAEREAAENGGHWIKAILNKRGWTFKTKIPHATFTVKEDARIYGHGIVFALADAGGKA